jgi:hypothetical protein
MVNLRIDINNENMLTGKAVEPARDISSDEKFSEYYTGYCQKYE